MRSPPASEARDMNGTGAHRGRPTAGALVVRVLVVTGLAVDAYIHIALASQRPPAPPGGGLSQVTLFYAQGAAAAVAALLVLFTGARWAYVIAFLVAASALGAILLYRYVNVGALGPLPNMYEPLWTTTKMVTSIAEAIATLAAVAGIVGPGRSR
ncbi:hypothetical protein [Amycolatopsis palatopharyngis]|uniref:hypothetical protein n=1 Tax=Amycolatopsis palatopharyngis TaxID=187982 RepID=UPI0013BE8CC4|nr:hypothetical protein [Amycolatopsis palatopharyngis]